MFTVVKMDTLEVSAQYRVQMAFLEENVWKLVETVWVTKHVTTLTECVWMDAMRDSKEIYVKQHVALENMGGTVSSDAVTIVTITKFVTPSSEIVANVRMASRQLNVISNVTVGIMERVVCFNVDNA